MLLVIGLVAVAPVSSRLAPGLLTPTLGFAIAVAGCFAAMALSLDVLAGHAGQLTLGHGAVVSIGALTSGVVTAKWHLPFVVGVLGAVLVAAAISWVFARPAVRLGALSLGAVTLTLAVAVDNAAFRWDWLTTGRESLVLPRPLAGTFRFSSSADYAAVAVAFAVVAWLVDQRVAVSRFGRRLHVVRDDERLAQALGIDPRREKQRAFVLAGGLAGMAGAAYGHLLITVGPETFGFSRLSLPLLALVVIGGQGSPSAVAAVGAAYGLLPRLLHPLEDWAPLLGALLFIHAVARNPEGVAESVRAARRRRRSPPAMPLDLAAVQLDTLGGATADRRGLAADHLNVEIDGRRILDGLSLRVPPATIVALVGPNGAGKTTALNAISGFVALASGSAAVDGATLTDRPAFDRRRLGIARTFQGGSLPGRLRVGEALLLGQPAGRRDARRAAEEVAAALGFADRLDVPLRELSIGQQRVLELVAAMTSGAPVLLLDEPSAGLAPPVVDQLGAQLRALRDTFGRSILLVEHNMRLVRAVADTVCVLERGQLVHEAPAPDFFARDAPELLTWIGGRS